MAENYDASGEVSVCRSGCETQDHKSWGDCVRAAGVQIGKLT